MVEGSPGIVGLVMSPDAESLEPAFVRGVLTEWAHWLVRHEGYSRRSSIAVLQDGGSGSGGFYSRPPVGTLPGATAERASVAMQRLRESDPVLAGVLATWYLRAGNPTAETLAQECGVTIGRFHSLRKSAERKFGGFYLELIARS